MVNSDLLDSGDPQFLIEIYHCYQLGILPKDSGYRPTSPYLKEDLRRCDEISKQVRYMTEHKIETMEVANLLGISEAAVRKNVQRGRNALAAKVQSK